MSNDIQLTASRGFHWSRLATHKHTYVHIQAHALLFVPASAREHNHEHAAWNAGSHQHLLSSLECTVLFIWIFHTPLVRYTKEWNPNYRKA